MKSLSFVHSFAVVGSVLVLGLPLAGQTSNATLLAWNNLGMHCMDSDYSVFSILPPYNTIEAQLIVGGSLVTTGSGYTITYQAIADPAGSINTTSVGKTNFFTFTSSLYGSVASNTGLLGWKMPGASNTPQSMLFEANNSPASGVSAPVNWFRAEGIPLTPYDDTLAKNPYPLMHLVARDSSNAIIASTDIVLPVSDEMDCRACHASTSGPAARPTAGWANDPNAERDYRLNILRLHDEREFALHATAYAAALSAKGYDASGLYANVVTDLKPVLCAACHASEALQGSGLAGIPPLTAAIHSYHATVMDPVLNLTLDSVANRAACYRCHPGSTTKCLRGAMGSAVASDGTMAMQCQNCHGTMRQVGASTRTGWFQEPNCQSCHTGTATHNNGQIRYTSAFTDSAGTVRVPADSTFATTPNTPASGLSLFRFSVGHGGLQCSACHGSTHAEFPSSHANDNISSIQHQGHAGPLIECSTCHTAGVPSTVTGGPHGMHPVGQAWVSAHSNAVENGGASACQACHGTDYRGTVLSQMQGDRSLSAFGTQAFSRGAFIGCYTCHNGPSNDNANSSTPPTVSSVSASTVAGQPVTLAIPVTGAGATVHILSQPAHGTVGINGALATYTSDAGYSGADSFTYAAYDGAKNSNVATGTITVGSGGTSAPALSTQPSSQSASAGANVTFTAAASGSGSFSYQWNKDGVAISGATGSSLTLTNVQSADAGNYTVIVTNSAGSTTSSVASLSVGSTNPGTATAPVFVIQPAGVSIATGQALVLYGQASGTPTLAYQWVKDGNPISGATFPSYYVAQGSAADTGTYVLRASTAAGTVSSTPAVVTFSAAAAPQFLSLSMRTLIQGGNTATAGINIAGSRSMTVLIRAAGPALQPYGVADTAPDPQLTVYNVTTGVPVKIAYNDDWDPSLAAIFTKLGAFTFASASKDAALLITLQPGLYTAEASDKTGTTGEVLIEVYYLP